MRILSLACVMWWLGLSMVPVKLMLPRMQKQHYFAKRKKKTLIYRSCNSWQIELSSATLEVSLNKARGCCKG